MPEPKHTPTPWRVGPAFGNYKATVTDKYPTLDIADIPHTNVDGEAEANAALIVQAVNAHAALVAENEELNALFDLQGARMAEATKMWREAHPGNDTTSPDLGALLEWLLNTVSLGEANEAALVAEVEALRRSRDEAEHIAKGFGTRLLESEAHHAALVAGLETLRDYQPGSVVLPDNTTIEVVPRDEFDHVAQIARAALAAAREVKP